MPSLIRSIQAIAIHKLSSSPSGLPPPYLNRIGPFPVQAAMSSINVKGMDRLHLGIVWARREDK